MVQPPYREEDAIAGRIVASSASSIDFWVECQKGVARVLNASRFKSIRACNVRVLSLSVEIVDLETSGKTSDLLEVVSRGSLHLQGLYGNIHTRGSNEVRLRRDLKHPYTRITRGKVKA